MREGGSRRCRYESKTSGRKGPDRERQTGRDAGRPKQRAEKPGAWRAGNISLAQRQGKESHRRCQALRRKEHCSLSRSFGIIIGPASTPSMLATSYLYVIQTFLRPFNLDETKSK
jgi:hypothetical protein